jgi:hypothetical protein
MTYKTLEDYKDQIPEGATHYKNEDFRNSFMFYRFYGEAVYVVVPGICEKSWMKTKYTTLGDIENLVALTTAQQLEWNGEGYPPVGVECEVSFSDDNVWDKCLVTYFGTSLCVIDFGDCERSFGISSVKFRPIETPGQKKEREELEAAYDLYKTIVDGEPLSYTFEQFRSSPSIGGYLKAVRKTNYKIK